MNNDNTNEKYMDVLLDDDFIKNYRKNMISFQRLMSCYKCAIMEVETKFKVLNERFSLEYDRNPIESIKTRLKSIEGIVGKLKRLNLPVEVGSIENNLNDIAGIRIICCFQDDIYRLADCFLQQDDIRLIEKKDYIKHPKESGYRSLHLIIEVPIFLENEKKWMRAEIQFRTIAMDFWASLEHKLRYKKDIPDQIAEQLAEELVTCADESDKLDRKMGDIRSHMYAKIV